MSNGPVGMALYKKYILLLLLLVSENRNYFTNSTNITFLQQTIYFTDVYSAR